MKKEKIKKIGKIIVSYIIVFIIMLSVFCIAMIATYALPNERIRGHINESKNLILTPNSNPILGDYVEGARMDEATDLLILNTALNKGKTEDENVLVRAFENSRYRVADKDDFYALQQTMENNEIHNNEEYSRYWHGIQTIIRPLLLFFNYEEIRYLFMIIMFILLGIAIWTISRNLSILHGMAFLMAMLAVCFFIVPISLQYIGVFAIMLVSVIVINILYIKR